MILDVVFKTIVFLILLSILVLVHEFGHFIVGRMLGVGVLEFALGLPFTKPIWSRKLKSGMLISLYPVLFGGFVRLLGEDQEIESGDSSAPNKVKGEYFYRKNVKSRLMIIVAGVFMNLVLAFAAFYLFLIASGFKVVIPRLENYQFLSPYESRVVINYVEKGSPADQAGLAPNMLILAVDNQQVMGMKEFQTYIRSHAGKEVGLKLTDIALSKNFEIAVTPRVNPPTGQGQLGIGMADAGLISFPDAKSKAFSGFIYGVDMFRYNWEIIGSLASESFKKKTAAPLAESVSGPVGIYNIVGSIVDIGGWQSILSMVNFLGMMSMSLAFMNILPIPAMDGGKMFLLIVEGLLRKKLSPQKENLVNQIGFFLLIGLMVLISFNDISKIFTR